MPAAVDVIQRVRINLTMLCKKRALIFFKVFSPKIKKTRVCVRGRDQKWNKYVLA